MSHTAYKLALIRREQLLREAADRRLAIAAVEGAPDAIPTRGYYKLPRFQWPFRASNVSPRLTARGR